MSATSSKAAAATPPATPTATPFAGTRSDGTARLDINGKTFDLPLLVGTEDERALDISKLRAMTGAITLDEGYVNTGSTTSTITFLDGEKGILRYRGYPIEVLAEKCDFVEVSYLLIYGKLPNSDELNQFRQSLSHHTMIHEDMRSFYGGFPRDAHPMATLGSVVGALSTFYQDSLEVRDPRQVEVSVHRLMAKLPTIAAYSHKKSIGQPLIYPRNDLSYCENFLQMMFAVPCEQYHVRTSRTRSTRSSSCTPTTSKTARHPRCAWWGRAMRISSPASRPASRPSGGRCTAGRTRPAWRCWRRSGRTAET
jgi:hypothetical protein